MIKDPMDKVKTDFQHKFRKLCRDYDLYWLNLVIGGAAWALFFLAVFGIWQQIDMRAQLELSMEEAMYNCPCINYVYDPVSSTLTWQENPQFCLRWQYQINQWNDEHEKNAVNT